MEVVGVGVVVKELCDNAVEVRRMSDRVMAVLSFF